MIEEQYVGVVVQEGNITLSIMLSDAVTRFVSLLSEFLIVEESFFLPEFMLTIFFFLLVICRLD